MQKNARALLFFLISVRCAVLKDPPKKVMYVQCYLNAKMEEIDNQAFLAKWSRASASYKRVSEFETRQ